MITQKYIISQQDFNQITTFYVLECIEPLQVIKGESIKKTKKNSWHQTNVKKKKQKSTPMTFNYSFCASYY